jgi:PAS domain S-box-containing protein
MKVAAVPREKSMKKTGIKTNGSSGRKAGWLNLEKSVRQLLCLYDIAHITGDPDTPLDEQLTEIAGSLPAALQYPALAFGRIVLGGKSYATDNYTDTDRKLAADIIVQGKKAGGVAAGYTQAPPVKGAGLFTKADRLLLNAVAERLGAFIERKQSAEFINTVYQNSPLGIYIMQEGKLIYTNARFQRLTGYTQDELTGRELTGLVATGDVTTVRSSTTLTPKAKNPCPCEYRLRNKGGQLKWVVQTVAPIHYQGRPAVLGNIMDITRRKRLERKLVEYEELDRMKSDLLSTVSHELRTPLATIKGYATMILNHYSRLSTDETLDCIKAINNSSDRLSRLVDNLLDTSRMESGLLKLQKDPTDIASLLEEAVREAGVRSGDHHISFAPGQPLPEVNLDARRIRQVVDNLINNAVKYSPEGTEITVTASRTGGELHISVTDQGPGIPAAELGKIFQRMYRHAPKAHSDADGIGLGLYISQRLVEAHGGRIWAESTVGRGSTFHLTLPLEEAARKAGPIARAGREKAALLTR